MTKEHVDKEHNHEEIFYAYTNYLMKLGDNKEKADFLVSLNLPLMLDNRKLYISKAEFAKPRPKPDR